MALLIIIEFAEFERIGTECGIIGWRSLSESAGVNPLHPGSHDWRSFLEVPSIL